MSNNRSKNRIFNTVFLIPAPERELNVRNFCDVWEAAGARYLPYAVRLKKDESGIVDFDADGVLRNVDADTIHENISRGIGLYFAISSPFNVQIRFDPEAEVPHIELRWKVKEASNYTAEQDQGLRTLLHECAARAEAAYIFRNYFPFRDLEWYIRFDEGVPRLTFERLDILNDSRVKLWVSEKYGGRAPIGENIEFLAGQSERKGLASYVGRAPRDHPEVGSSSETLYADLDFWGDNPEDWLSELEAEASRFPPWEEEVDTNPIGSPDSFAVDAQSAFQDLIPAGWTVESFKPMGSKIHSIVSDEKQLAEIFSPLPVSQGALSHSTLQSRPGPDFTVWKRVARDLSEAERLKEVLIVFNGIKHIVEPLAITFRIHYHNSDWGTDTSPIHKVTARVLELPSYVALITHEDIIVPLAEDILSGDSLRKLLEASLRLPPPEGANRNPFWSEVTFRCARLSIWEQEIGNYYLLNLEEKQRTISFPVERTADATRIHTPDIESWASLPIDIKAIRFLNILGVQFKVNWSAWRTKGMSEYVALQEAILQLRSKGWRIDDHEGDFFDAM